MGDAPGRPFALEILSEVAAHAVARDTPTDDEVAGHDKEKSDAALLNTRLDRKAPPIRTVPLLRPVFHDGFGRLKSQKFHRLGLPASWLSHAQTLDDHLFLRELVADLKCQKRISQMV